MSLNKLGLNGGIELIELIYKGDLLKWFAGCGSSSPVMAVSQWESQETSSYSVHKSECLDWSSVYTGIMKE